MSDHQYRGALDRAIDATVRDMIHRDPRPGLSRRVARRIRRSDAAEASGGRIWRSLRLAALPLAAAVVLAVGLLSSLRSPATPSAPSPQVVASQPFEAASPPVASTAAPPPAAPAASPRAATSSQPSPEAIFGPRADRVRAASVTAAPAGAIDEPERARPTREPEPAVSPDYAPIVIPPLRIEPIAIAPLTLRPLTERR